MPLALSQKYIVKLDSLRHALCLLDVSRADLLQRYDNKFFKDSEIAKSEFFSRVLDQNLTSADINYLESKCADLRYSRDSRTGSQYGLDLVCGWLIEDGFLSRLKRAGVSVTLAGDDRFREFLPSGKISTRPDMSAIGSDGQEVALELLADWRGTWAKEGHLDLRDNKLVEMLRKNAILFGVAPLSGQGFVSPILEMRDEFVPAYIPAYKKAGYTNSRIASRLSPLRMTLDNLIRLIG